MPEKSAGERSRVTLRLPCDLHVKLVRLAKLTDRSLNNAICWVLADTVDTVAAMLERDLKRKQ